MPPVRLAPRDELAGRPGWRRCCGPRVICATGLPSIPRWPASQVLDGSDCRCGRRGAGADARRARRGLAGGRGRQRAERRRPGLQACPVPLRPTSAEDVLESGTRRWRHCWRREELDGLATALYTVGAPVRMDALFDAYAAAAGTAAQAEQTRPRRAAAGARPAAARRRDQGAALSHALETLADLGVVELGTEDAGGEPDRRAVSARHLGRAPRLLAQGWHVPVIGAADGTARSACWRRWQAATPRTASRRSRVAGRPVREQAAAELIAAAATGTPGLRGAAFAVLDRIGKAATEEVRAALDRAAAARARRGLAA